MTDARLTDAGLAAIRGGMKTFGIRIGLTLSLALLAGCVNVEAPTEPIVINLNINIKQEVVYRLNEDAQELIQSEAEIF